MLRAFILSIVVSLLIFTGTAIAATDAGPDSILYPIKRYMEDFRTTVAFNPLEKAVVETNHADARLDEIDDMVKNGKSDYVPELLEAYEQHVAAAAGYLDEAALQGENVRDLKAKLASVADRRNITLIRCAAEMPAELLAAIDDAIQESNYRYSGSDGKQGAGTNRPVAVDSGGGMPEPEATAGGDNQTGLPDTVAGTPANDDNLSPGSLPGQSSGNNGVPAPGSNNGNNGNGNGQGNGNPNPGQGNGNGNGGGNPPGQANGNANRSTTSPGSP